MIITGGRVLDPASGRDEEADVVVVDGRVERIGRGLDPGEAQVIDASGCFVTPGLIDPHVHLREPGGEHKETIESGTRAAVAGGFTTVCCMPNTSPAIDRPEIAMFVNARAKETGHCRVHPVGAATIGRQGEQLSEITLLKKAGCVAISDDGDVVQDAGMMSKVLKMCAHADLPFMQHCQDVTMTKGAIMHAGSVATAMGVPGWPRLAEEIIIERDVRLNREANASYHVQHMSSGGSVEIIRRARDAGQRVSAEVSPHHLLLTHDACESIGADAKMNPPLRERSDIEALLEGVADGTITILATDHAPHTREEKATDLASAPFGIIGLETALALYVEALVEPGIIDWPRLVELLTVNPAKLCGLSSGTLSEGGPADLTIFHPDDPWTIGDEHLVGLSRNTPFLGREVRTRVRATIVGGRLAWSV